MIMMTKFLGGQSGRGNRSMTAVPGNLNDLIDTVETKDHARDREQT